MNNRYMIFTTLMDSLRFLRENEVVTHPRALQKATMMRKTQGSNHFYYFYRIVLDKSLKVKYGDQLQH